MEILNKLEQVARDAGAVANMMVEIGKLKVKIRRKQDEVKREKQRIGEIMWNKFSSQQEVPGEVAQHCEKIRDFSAEIEILSNAIDAIKSQKMASCECCCDSVTCPSCGTEEFCDANYCSNCGVKLHEQECCCDSDCDCEETE